MFQRLGCFGCFKMNLAKINFISKLALLLSNQMKLLTHSRILLSYLEILLILDFQFHLSNLKLTAKLLNLHPGSPIKYLIYQ